MIESFTPNTGQGIKPLDLSKSQPVYGQSIMKEYHQAIIVLNCWVQAIYESLPPEDQNNLMDRFEEILAAKNLKVVR